MTIKQQWQDPDWLIDASQWIETELEKRQLSATAPLERVSGWALGHILRQGTSRGDFYFKATARLPLFSNEASLCATLHELFPGATPAPLAIRADRQWQLTASFGQALPEDSETSVWADAFADYARLQSRSPRYLDRLRASGCLARPIEALPAQLAEAFDNPDITAMLPAVVRSNTAKTLDKVATAITALGRHPLPEALVHGDLHIENIAKTQDGFVFFDWSDACISHPFIDGTYLYRMAGGPEKERIIDGYLSGWTQLADKAELRQCWDTAEILCYAHQALSYGSMMLNIPEPGRTDLKTAFENAFIRLSNKAS
ncbi:aminoglycoside phosphotransferase family protein [Gallaecimonas sp. GXIMD4217]|uniref:aminoglycoside phosphotransferase family protein n=1 Tax=Gallaecimonas sp. GXIMD4217 TaxID=3131927 RepID=UPI00311B3548